MGAVAQFAGPPLFFHFLEKIDNVEFFRSRRGIFQKNYVLLPCIRLFLKAFLEESQ